MRVEKTRARGARLSGFGCGAALLTGLGVVVIVSLVSALLFLLSPGGNDAVASFIHPQPGSVHWNRQQRLNVLLLGVSQHSSGTESAGALFVVSFDPHAGTVHTLAVPPDLWMTIPGFGPSRIADAYADGGPRLALHMVQDITHVPIPYYVVMDLDAFKRTVDTLGGLNVEMPTVLSASRDAMPVGNLEMTGVAGTRRHLTGSSALRFMQTGAAGALGDIDQMQREQEVLFALQRAVLQPQAFVRIPSLVATVGGSVPTNFPYNQVPALARALASVPASGVRGASLDYASHAVTDYSSDGQHVLLPDWQRIDTIAQQVFSDPGLRQGGRVAVWNGSGVDGQAATLAEWLRQAGLPVLNVSSAPRDYARTSVVISSAASPRERYTANAVATLLQAPVVARRAQRGPVITVIIGHNFQDPSPQ